MKGFLHDNQLILIFQNDDKRFFEISKSTIKIVSPSLTGINNIRIAGLSELKALCFEHNNLALTIYLNQLVGHSNKRQGLLKRMNSERNTQVATYSELIKHLNERRGQKANEPSIINGFRYIGDTDNIKL